MKVLDGRSKPQTGDLKVWHIPQVPMKSFDVSVSSVFEGEEVRDLLAAYDEFQFKNRVKGDYSNVSGISMFTPNADGEGTPGWTDYDEGEYAYWLDLAVAEEQKA